MPPGPLRVYTDGSKQKSKVGAGFAILKGEQFQTYDLTYLGTQTTVFQAEVFAIGDAANFLLEKRRISPQEYPTIPTIILSDSQAAIRALDSPDITSKVVLEATSNLDGLAQETSVEIRWIKAHVGHVGNELADRAAKAATELEMAGPGPFLPVPIIQRKKDIYHAMEKEWLDRWNARSDCRQSKMHWAAPDRYASVALLHLTREEIGATIQILSGHNFFNYHREKLGKVESSLCRLCGADTDETESSDHLLRECPRLNETRFEALGQFQIPETNVTKLSLKDVAQLSLRVCELLNDSALHQN